MSCRPKRVFRVLGPVEISGVVLEDSPELRILVALLLQPNRVVPMARLVEAGWDDPPRHPAKAVRAGVSALRRRLPDGLITTESAGYALRVPVDEIDLSLFRLHVAQSRQLAATGQVESAAERMRAALSLWRGAALDGVGGRFAAQAAARLDEERLAALQESSEHVPAFGEGPPVPRQTPPDVVAFTGRLEYLAELDDLFVRHAATAVVISAIAGTAGVGKTALAVRWAHRMSGRFPDGQLYVNLRGYDSGRPLDPSEALAGFLVALGVESARMPFGVEERAALYRSLLAGRRMLILADNAASAAQVRPLLPGARGCAVVVTSRSSLAGLVIRDGAQRINLDALAPDEAIELTARIIGRDRVEAEPEAVAALAAHCAYLPLALRIAAERVVTRPQARLQELVNELAVQRQRLDVLALDADTASEVRAVFSWSYQALSAEVRKLFRLIGLHSGPEMSLHAVAALAGADPAETQGWLDVLVSEHLLEQIGPERYQLHDLLRAYAAELTEQDPERERAVDRLFQWYVHTAEAADRHIAAQALRLPLDPHDPAVRPKSFGSRAQALDWCETERANLVAATRHAFDRGMYEHAWRLPATPWGFFNLSKHWDDWISTYEIALKAARLAGHRQGEAWTLCGLGLALTDLRRFEQAVECERTALAISGDLGDTWGEGWALGNLGSTYRAMGRVEDAIDCHRQAFAISRTTGDRWGEGWGLHNLANDYSSSGRHDEAIDHYQRALVIRREVGDQWGEGWTLHNLANLYSGSGQVGQAVEHYRQAVAVSHEIGDRWSEVRILHKLGRTHRLLAEPAAAIDCFQRALALRHAVGDNWGAARVLADLGGALSDIGQTDAARRCWRESLRIFDELGDPRAESVRALLG